MKITEITAHVIKSATPYRPIAQARDSGTLPGTDYIRLDPYRQVYSRRAELVIVRVGTDEGIVGWGESNAPIAPEITQTAIAKVVGPAVLGRDPLATGVRYTDMYETTWVRGHFSGYQLDAIAAVDTALWDIRGKAEGRSVAELLGGRFRDTLTCYASGLRGHTRAERLEEATQRAKQGIGTKSFLGFGCRADSDEVAALREAVGSEGRLYVDTLWRYRQPEAARLGRALQEVAVEFFEAPIAPEDIAGHATLAGDLDISIAIGEMLRTRVEFLPWLRARALDVCQPDLMKAGGVTETARIAALADTFHLPVALHVGTASVVGMAATWQTAASLPNFLVQEHQPVMFDTFNGWLEQPLRLRDGELVVPDGPGLGISIDEDRFGRDVDSAVTIRLE